MKLADSITICRPFERRATTIVFYDVDEQDVIDGMENARKFIKAIEDYIAKA